MGGVSEGRASVRSGPEGPYVRLEGLVSTANNGGFIQIRTEITDGVKDAEGIFINRSESAIAEIISPLYWEYTRELEQKHSNIKLISNSLD